MTVTFYFCQRVEKKFFSLVPNVMWNHQLCFMQMSICNVVGAIKVYISKCNSEFPYGGCGCSFVDEFNKIYCLPCTHGSACRHLI